jgi:hypothetical protein
MKVSEMDEAVQAILSAQGVSAQGVTAAALSRAQILAIVFAALGVGTFATVLISLIPSRYITDLETAIRLRRWSAVKTQLGNILGHLRSDAFYADLIHAVGINVALQLILRICSRFIPFFGWVLLIGSIVAQIIDLVL